MKLAAYLRMPVYAMLRAMPASELAEWRAFFDLQEREAGQADLAARAAAKLAAQGRRR